MLQFTRHSLLKLAFLLTLLAVVLSSSVAAAVESQVAESSSATSDSTIDRISFEIQRLQSQFENHKRPAVRSLIQQQTTQVEEDENSQKHNCEVKFISCLTHPKCVACFSEINSNEIDWSFVAADTTCNSILDVLAQKFHKCDYLNNDQVERVTFCETFDKCVIFEGMDNDDDYDDDYDSDNNRGSGGGGGDDKNADGEKKDKKKLNCDELTKCEFDGFKPSYIGDGICHEFIGGCYNHKICNYDGGDCCPDTCQNKTDYAGCGTDGFFCRDPQSTNCTKCENNSGGKSGDGDKKDDKKKGVIDANCTKDESPYELLQFDSFGDGWEFSTDMNITVKVDGDDSKSAVNVYRGKLKAGFKGNEIICLSNKPTCYEVFISGGSWGNDITWQIKPKAAGSREVASGGSPMHCEFPIAGASCSNTCLGQTHPDSSKDNNFQSYTDLTACMQEKCIIQYSACLHDDSCNPCMIDNPPPYCLTNGNYTAIVFCSQCNCVEGAKTPERQKFCSAKSKKEIKYDDDEMDDDDASSNNSNNDGNKVAKCDWEQRKEGMDAIVSYTACSGMKVEPMLKLFEFDNDNFGLLDVFEGCAAGYLRNPYGASALKCMQLLQEAIDNPSGSVTGETKDKTIPIDAIKAIANDLLHNGHDFCDCSAKATQLCPACSDFKQFKVLLYESLDACNALDEIDCAAWQEFAGRCSANIKTRYKGKVNFRKNKQCDYVLNERCGNLGVFPALRQLDCSSEITQESWDMYVDFQKYCMKAKVDPIPGSSPNPKPVPPYPTAPVPYPTTPAKPAPYPTAPVPYPTAPVPKPSSKENYPSDPFPFSNNSPHKKYVSPEAKSGRPFKNFLFICILGGIAYWLYKKRSELDFTRFRIPRRVRNFYPPQFNNNNHYTDYDGSGDSGMYESLTLTDMSGPSSFQPPTLPPGASAYGPPNGTFG